MKLRLPILSVAAGLFLAGAALGQASPMYGVYGQCVMACRYIKINPDHTFEELLDGDLFNDQRKKGVWTAETKTTIRARSEKPSPLLRVREAGGMDTGFLLTVVDFVGATVPGAQILGTASDNRFECITTDDGTCAIPRVSSFEVKWNGFTGNHTVTDPAATRFQVELTSAQMDTFIDEVWMIKGNYLYIEDDGRFDKVDPLKKVSTKKARKLFAEKR